MVVKRDPEATRKKLLQAAFHEIYRHGFRSASLETILGDTGVTKGALYHHFESKTALGYAVVEEVIGQAIREQWVRPLEAAADPVQALEETLARATCDSDAMACECGCPLNNLAQEMSSVDEGFRSRLRAVYEEWTEGISAALRRGQRQGTVRRDLRPESAACFIVASIEGSAGLAKNAHNPDLLKGCLESLRDYIRSLRSAR
jgi:AcrR family transcriptional regulator